MEVTNCFSVAFFKIFSLSVTLSFLTMMCLFVCLFAFILGVHGASMMCRLVFFYRFGELFALLQIFFSSFSPSVTLSSRATRITELVICSYVNSPQAALPFRFLCLLYNCSVVLSHC